MKSKCFFPAWENIEMPRLGSQVRLFPLGAASWAEPNPSLAQRRDRCRCWFPTCGQVPTDPAHMGLISAALLAPPTWPDSAQTWGFPPLPSKQRTLCKPGAFPWVTAQLGHDPTPFCFPGKRRRRSWEGRVKLSPGRRQEDALLLFLSILLDF